MYRVFKPTGYGNITIENTDSMASMMIDRTSTDVLRILKEGGCTIPDSYQEEWDIEVNKDIAEKLCNLAMRMKKPIRDQRKKVEQKDNKEIDAIDVLLGLAKYNK